MQRAQSCLSHIPLVSTQQEYNLIDRTVEQRIMPFCTEEKLTLIAYSPLLRGKIAASDRRKDVLCEVASKYGTTVAQLVLSWLLRDPCTIVIPKASSEQHLRENAAVPELQIEPADYERISELYALEVENIPTDLVEVAEDANRNVYRTLDEAIENRLDLVPSPIELAEQIVQGELLKPVKLRLDATDPGKVRYRLLEGRVRYWAWVIAHDGQVPIPALVERSE